MSTTNNVEIKKAMLSTDKTLLDQNNLEIPPNSIIHCLGSLFQVSDQGLRHIVGKKIDSETYFADSDLYIDLNELAFVEQKNVTSTPDAALKEEGLLASAYRFMTAPFLVRTPNNVTTRNRRKMSNPNKLVGSDKLTTSAVSGSPSEAEHVFIIRLNAKCEKAVMNEVKFFIHSYEEFMNCTNEKFQSVISALNAANLERYNEVKIQYPDFTWQPPLIEISMLVTLIQRAYPAQVVEYILGRKKSSLENAVKTKEEEPPGLFPATNPKVNNVYNENFRDFNEEQLINEVNDDDRDHTSHQIRMVMTTDQGQDHRK